VLGDRPHAIASQVHHVQVVPAKPAQVLLDLAAQLVGAGHGEPLAGGLAPRADLVVTATSSRQDARARLMSSFAERSGEK